MADSGDSASSWPGFLSELGKSFLVLRDVFGYALPGAVFLGVGLVCHRFSLRDVQYYIFDTYHPPAWLAAVAALGACYAIGHVMAAIAYLRYNFKKKKDSKQGNSTDDSEKLILARGQHPELLIELDRQDTMTMMRGSTGAALLLGSVFFWWVPKTPPLGWMLSAAGILLLAVFYWSAMPHINELKASTITAAAAENAAAKGTTANVDNLKRVLQEAIAAFSDALSKL
jgi:amino acid transporter